MRRNPPFKGDPPPAACNPLERCVILRADLTAVVLTPAEAEQLSADLLRSAASARAYREPKRKPFGGTRRRQT